MSSKKLCKGRIFGRWTLQELIGQGGNGVVWFAVDSAGNHGAIKFIKSHHLSRGEQGERNVRLQRFIDEIRFLDSRTGTPGIIPLLDFHCPVEPDESDRPWFVTPIGTELGCSVASELKKVDAAVSAIRAVARTLADLHATGVFHRDIKPANILVIGDSVCLSDFGLVQFPEKGAVTGSGEFMGPLFYIAPEMMTNSPGADPAKGDVYSLAKTLWVVATGQKYPLPGEQRMEVAPLTLSAYIEDPRCRSLDALLDAATRHAPDLRPTMRIIADELSAWLLPATARSSIVERLDEIARTHRPTMQSLQVEQTRREQHGAAIDELWNRVLENLKPQLQALEDMQLHGATGVIVKPQLISSGGEPHFWYDWPRAPRPISQNVFHPKCAFLVQQLPGLAGRSVAYCGGIRFGLTENETVRITAAHAFGSINSDAREFSDCPWTQDIEVHAGLPTAERNLDGLMEDFANRLPDALDAMLKLLERIGRIRPP